MSGVAANVAAVAVNPSSTQTVYAGAKAGTGLTSGVFKTTTGGSTWTLMNSGLTTTDVRALVFDASPMLSLYAGTNGGGVFKSTDGGKSWKKVFYVDANTGANTIVMDAKNPSVLYVAIP